MSYLVLARQYRPKNFSQLVGQAHVVQALSNALTSQRLHHAYLFTGTRGVGKTTVSRILAKSLNCLGVDGNGGITAEPCGVCQACADIDSGRFVDYTELDAASNRGVDEVQQLLEQAVYKPVQGRFKVFMIDEVHMLTGHAFNAMLKTLEEPPEYLKFVLATTDPQKVPVTVLSRCLQFNLRPMAPDTIQLHLADVLTKENVAFDATSLRLLSRAAKGSMRDALSLTDQSIAYGAGALSEETVRQMLGAVDEQYIYRLIEALAQGAGGAVIDVIQTLRLAGLNVVSTLDQMLDVLHRMAVLQTLAGAATGSGAAEEPELLALSAQMPADEIQLLYSLCLHGRGELHLSPDEYAALTMIVLRLLAFKNGSAVAPEKKSHHDVVAKSPTAAPPVTSTATTEATSHFAAQQNRANAEPETAGSEMAASRVARLPVREQSAPTERTEPRSAQRVAMDATPTNLTPIPSTPLGDEWFAIVESLLAQQNIAGMPRELAVQSSLLEKNKGEQGSETWTLQVESDLLTQVANIEKFQTAVRTLHPGVSLVVQIGTVADSAAKRLAYASAARQAKAEEIIASDPDVQHLMREFGGRIVPGSVRVVL